MVLAGRQVLTRRQERKLTELLFLFPTVFAFVMVIIVPFILGIFYSFTNWDGVRTNVAFIGLRNYSTIFSEPAFLHATLSTARYTVLNVVMVNVVAFLLSLLVTGRVRGRNLYRAGFFVPNLIGGIVLGSIWQFIFNNALPVLGKEMGIAALSTSIISNKDTAVLALAIVNTWQYAGYIMMIYVASIQGLPGSVMEAAEVDGANFWTRTWRILIPLMASAFTISLFLTLTTSFKMYDVNVALTNGGPSGVFMKKPINASEMLAMNIYNTAFKYARMAEGQAKSVVFFLILVVISLVQVSYNKRKEVEM